MCVVQQVEAWSGQTVIDLGSKIGDLYTAGGGVCDGGALRALAKLIETNCGADVGVANMSCTMTVSRLTRVACGV